MSSDEMAKAALSDESLGNEDSIYLSIPFSRGGKRTKSKFLLNILCKAFVLLAISFEYSKPNSINLMYMHLWSSGYDVSLTR